MGAEIVDGRGLAERIKNDVQREVALLRGEGVGVRLDAVMVGEPAAGRIYASSQEARCAEVGIEYRLHALPAEAGQDELRACIHQLNDDPAVTGIMLQLPLPAGMDTPAMQYCIDPYKDVEGVNPANIGLLFYGNPIIAPCTALAVRAVLDEFGCSVRGKHACVIGQGAVAGRPITLALLSQNATVTGCCVDTPDLKAHSRRADIVIAAAGVPHLVTAEHVKSGAVVIDVGINRVPGRTDAQGKALIVGDVDFESVRGAASMITPVPGGVGPVTVAILLRSAAEAARKQHHEDRLTP
ncbi:MAG: bifunctional 5,10-methylenetetrahydrofolate dehydrogenase/5,10-methenyltetrahydrofolate cyclohydrolase [bacterium]|nr:bifunctional 5,10-methylenetetrahydrofolate dehydrogenase/5,10-methenyltetrahydrofolate cyclohydrolase [bacterium]